MTTALAEPVAKEMDLVVPAAATPVKSVPRMAVPATVYLTVRALLVDPVLVKV